MSPVLAIIIVVAGAGLFISGAVGLVLWTRKWDIGYIRTKIVSLRRIRKMYSSWGWHTSWDELNGNFDTSERYFMGDKLILFEGFRYAPDPLSSILYPIWLCEAVKLEKKREKLAQNMLRVQASGAARSEPDLGIRVDESARRGWMDEMRTRHRENLNRIEADSGITFTMADRSAFVIDSAVRREPGNDEEDE